MLWNIMNTKKELYHTKFNVCMYVYVILCIEQKNEQQKKNINDCDEINKIGS